jgi:hypothetical protein
VSDFLVKLAKALPAILVSVMLAVPSVLVAAGAGLISPGNPYKWGRSSSHSSRVHYSRPACRSTASSAYRYSSASRQKTLISRHESRYNRVSYSCTRQMRGVTIKRTGGRTSYGNKKRYSHREKILFYRNSMGNRGVTIGKR